MSSGMSSGISSGMSSGLRMTSGRPLRTTRDARACIRARRARSAGARAARGRALRCASARRVRRAPRRRGRPRGPRARREDGRQRRPGWVSRVAARVRAASSQGRGGPSGAARSSATGARSSVSLAAVERLRFAARARSGPGLVRSPPILRKRLSGPLRAARLTRLTRLTQGRFPRSTQVRRVRSDRLGVGEETNPVSWPGSAAFTPAGGSR